MNGILFRAFTKKDLDRIESIYKMLNLGQNLSSRNITLLKLIGKKICSVVEKDGQGVIAFNLFYFNPRDIKEGTIHNAYAGFLPVCQGGGIGKRLYAYAVSHFSKTCLSGISGRISLSNFPPFKITTALGYKVVEKYFDPEMDEERVYIRLNFYDNS
jgi:GNAT superfamily N-acetyltransferase